MVKTRRGLFISIAFALSLSHAPSCLAQGSPTEIKGASVGHTGGQEEVVRVKTRVVFIDALVRDKRTGSPVRDLGRDDFQVLDDGHPRDIEYFSDNTERRRPLALVLVVDAWPSPEGWLVKGDAIMDRFAAALKELPPGDEVGVAVTMFGEPDSPCEPTTLGKNQVVPLQVLQGLTRDREAVAAALRTAPQLARQLYEARDEQTPKKKQMVYKPSGLLCLPGLVGRLAAERPTSQVAALVVTDDINIFYDRQRAEMTEEVARAGVIVHSLSTRFHWLFSDVGVIGDLGRHINPGPVEKDRQAYVVQAVAEDTGGEVVRVRAPDEYPAAFERIMRGLASRYSLGFVLGEGEADDGRLHKLEVRINTRGERVKGKRLEVVARRGYYMPKPGKD